MTIDNLRRVNGELEEKKKEGIKMKKELNEKIEEGKKMREEVTNIVLKSSNQINNYI